MRVEWAAMLLLLTAQLGCLNMAGECDDEVRGEARSPGGRWVATTYVRNCGATAAYATHVVIRDAALPFRPWRNGGPGDQGLVYVEEQQPTIELVWQGPNELAIRSSGGGGRIFRRENHWRGVAIVSSY
jgi:hypothetical protein